MNLPLPIRGYPGWHIYIYEAVQPLQTYMTILITLGVSMTTPTGWHLMIPFNQVSLEKTRTKCCVLMSCVTLHTFIYFYFIMINIYFVWLDKVLCSSFKNFTQISILPLPSIISMMIWFIFFLKKNYALITYVKSS